MANKAGEKCARLVRAMIMEEKRVTHRRPGRERERVYVGVDDVDAHSHCSNEISLTELGKCNS